MTLILTICFRLSIWLLLTADLSPANIAIGVAIALLLPRTRASIRLWDWCKLAGQVLIAIPQAYGESLAMILRPHNQEQRQFQPVTVRPTPGLIFLDIFRITFTPKTIVLRHDPAQGYEVHQIESRRSS